MVKWSRAFTQYRGSIVPSIFNLIMCAQVQPFRSTSRCWNFYYTPDLFNTAWPLLRSKVVGLAVITAASTTTSSRLAVQKWVYVLAVPTVVTALVYAAMDRSKFQGYSSAKNIPLSNWSDGSFGLVDFYAIFDDPGQYTLYVVRLFVSIVINITSVLLVLIDTVCLQVRIR